jgi:hypothetical protein
VIIKSMSRKEGSFRQLIEYMERGRGEAAFSHNLCTGIHGRRDDIIREFEKNAARLRERKNGNALYHEVISLEAGAEIARESMVRILSEIGMEYVSRRAPLQMALGMVHTDSKHVHLHMCISANDVGKPRRERLSKGAFSDIQKEMDALVRERWAELGQSQIYGRERPAERLKTTNAEQEMKRRRGEPSRKEDVKARVHGAFQTAGSAEELLSLLRAGGLEFYQRGKTAGVIDQETGRRHRLSTLGVEAHYTETVARLFGSGRSAETEHQAQPGGRRQAQGEGPQHERQERAQKDPGKGRGEAAGDRERDTQNATRAQGGPERDEDQEMKERRRLELANLFRRRDRNRERER